MTGQRFLNALRQKSIANSNQIKILSEKFEVTIKQMQEFLESSSASAAAAAAQKKKSSERKVHFNKQLVTSSSD